ncbi:hypothetical protein MMC21_003024 [Puttea exsequens]|nr:hypothetical protein [Puttea exsequens]
MAKTKPHDKAEPNERFSTAAMFNKARFVNSRAASNATKNSKHRKVIEISDHPIVTDFSNAIGDSRAHIGQKADAKIGSHFLGFEQSLNESTAHFKEVYDEANKALAKLTVPFQDQEVEWQSKDGTRTSGTTSLDYRMRKLKKIVDTEEANISAKWEEWTELQKEIMAIVGQNQVFQASKGLEDGMEVDWDMSFISNQGLETLQAELETQKKNYLAELEELLGNSVQAMEESEKKIQLNDKRIEKQFLAVLREDFY